MLRILHLTKFYPPAYGGVETVTQSLAEPLVYQFPGVQVTVLCMNTGPQTLSESTGNFRLIRAGIWGMVRSAAITWSLPKWVYQELKQCDVFIVHQPNPNQSLSVLLAHLLDSSLRHKKCISFWHSDVVRQKFLYHLYAPLERWFLRRSDVILMATQNHGDFSRVLPQYRNKWRVIPYGLPDLPTVPDSHQVLKKYGLSDQGFILSVGRLVSYKGFPVFLKALASMKSPAVLVGSGPLADSLKVQRRELGLEGRLLMLSNLPEAELVALYQHCAFFVLPSVMVSEGFGMVQLEAMRASKAVINTALRSGVPLVSLHEQTGLTVPPGDPEALRVAMQTLWDDLALRSHYGLAGRARFLAHFEIGQVLQQHYALYQSLLSASQV